jgi:hypothetical protein
MSVFATEAHRIIDKRAAAIDAIRLQPGQSRVKKRFTEKFGTVSYTTLKAKPPHWRHGYAATANCELGCGGEGEYGTAVVFDHCHRHGWVRGLVCNMCNSRIGQIEAVMAIPGVRVDLGTSPWATFLAGCPDCKAGGGDAAAAG